MANKLVAKECPTCGKKKLFKGDVCPKCREETPEKAKCKYWYIGNLCANRQRKSPFCNDIENCQDKSEKPTEVNKLKSKSEPEPEPESASESKPKSESNPVLKTSLTIHTDGKLSFTNPTDVEMQVTKGFLFKRKRGDTEGMRIRYRRKVNQPVKDSAGNIIRYVKVWGRWYPYPRKNIVKLN